MPSQYTHEPGERFGRLVVIRKDDTVIHRAGVRWVCRCDCGKIRSIRGSNLRSGTRSCGCLTAEVAGARTKGQFRYGAAAHSIVENRIWGNMLQRCANPRLREWQHYGGRGITVCERWRTFEHFYADMGQRPSPQHSLDRIDNDGPYSPENCRWATRIEQGRNKRNNHLLTFDGLTLPIRAWSERTGISRETIAKRIKLGWPIERLLTEPMRRW